MTPSIRLKRYRAGWYETEDGRYAIYSYQPDDSKGVWWNICRYEHDGHLASTGEFEPTLADAREVVARMVARDEDGRDPETLYR